MAAVTAAAAAAIQNQSVGEMTGDQSKPLPVGRGQSATTESTVSSSVADVPKKKSLAQVDDSVGTSTYKLNSSILEEAKAKIRQAEEDRKSSGIPPRLIPLVEMCLPHDYRLSQFETDVGERTDGLKRLLGSCTTSACLGNVDDGSVDRKSDDGALFEDAEGN